MRLFCQNVIYSGLTCLHCGQLVAGVTRWLNTHWRGAKVICLDFRGYPAEGNWAASQPAASSPSAGCVHVLRVTCSSTHPRPPTSWDGQERTFRVGTVLPQGLPRWVAGVAPMCHNLVALHLQCVELSELPALPVLVHLILEHCMFHEVLVASLQGLASLETLHMRGRWGPSTRGLGRFRVASVTYRGGYGGRVSSCAGVGFPRLHEAAQGVLGREPAGRTSF